MEKKLQKMYLKYYNLLIAHNLWQAHFVNNISERIHKNKCKYEHDDKDVKHVELHMKYATVFLNTQTLKMI